MKVVFFIIPITLLIIFFYIIYLNIKKLKEVRNKKEFENCYSFYDIKNTAKRINNIEAEHVLKEVKKIRNKTLKIWFLSLLLAIVIFILTGIISSQI